MYLLFFDAQDFWCWWYVHSHRRHGYVGQGSEMEQIFIHLVLLFFWENQVKIDLSRSVTNAHFFRTLLIV